MTITWNSADKGTNIALTSSDKVATITGGANYGVRGGNHKTAGLWYIEFSNITWVGGNGRVGVSDLSTSLNDNSSLASFAMDPSGGLHEATGGSFSSGNTPTGGDSFDLAINITTGKGWFRFNNGSWFGTAAGDPAAGTNGASLSGITDFYPWFWGQFTGTTCTIEGDTAARSIPSGFTIWGGSSATTAPGATVTENNSIISGGAGTATNAPGDIVVEENSIIGGGAGDTSALDGSKILEFTSHLIASPNVYQTSDFESIYSIGDRVASGLMTTGHHFPGTAVIFATEDQNFDLNYANVTGSGLLFGDGGTAINAGDGWYFNTGPNYIDLRGFRLMGADRTDNLNVDSWVIKPGFSPTEVFDISYASNFNSFVPVQDSSTLETYTGLKSATYQITPQAPIPYPHYEFQLANTGRLGNSPIRFCNEMELEIAHSTLDGGDRRPSSAVPSKQVVFTLGPGLVFRVATNFIDPQDALFDGENYYGAAQNGHTLQQSEIGEGAFGTQVTTVGKYIEFTFPRKVMMQHLVMQLSNSVEDYDSGGNPTVLGAWHWEVSNTGIGSYLSLAQSFKFGEGAKYALAPGQAPFDVSLATDTDGYSHWRLVLDGGAFGGGNPINQIMFDLIDKAEQQPTLSILFTDDVDGLNPNASVGSPGSPFTVTFTDGSDDKLTAQPTVIINPLLSVAFTDEGDFEPIGDFYPALYVQTLLMVTGRK